MLGYGIKKQPKLSFDWVDHEVGHALNFPIPIVNYLIVVLRISMTGSHHEAEKKEKVDPCVGVIHKSVKLKGIKHD